MRVIKNLKGIAAHVTTKWQYAGRGAHPKFLPGDRTRVIALCSESPAAQPYFLKKGTIVAVTIAPDGKLRGRCPNSAFGFGGRQYTRYYVRFSNKVIRGFHSHNLE